MGYVYTDDKGVKWYLNTKEIMLGRGDKKRLVPIYYFSKDERDTACDLPDDRELVVNSPTVGKRVAGMPFLRKIKPTE